MRNYEYIIASLPFLDKDGKSVMGIPEEELLSEILEQCSDKDRGMIAFLQKGWEDENLTPEFYKEATSHKNRFLRRYFSYDLMLRNAKVAYLNEALSRPEGLDVMEVEGVEIDELELSHIEKVLRGGDLLERERGLDEAMWTMIDDAVLMDVFTFDIVLAFVAKLHIVRRWLNLDPQTGREMFRRLVDEIRGTFKGVEFEA